jgi:hypothetical protein
MKYIAIAKRIALYFALVFVSINSFAQTELSPLKMALMLGVHFKEPANLPQLPPPLEMKMVTHNQFTKTRSSLRKSKKKNH